MLMRVARGSELAIREQSALSQLGPVDVALALLHGPFGEDGTIQGLFEMMGTRYVGAGVLASAVGMDKHFMKLVLAAAGLPVGPFVAITPAEWRGIRRPAWKRSRPCTFPVFVKPARGGSSIGISKVDAPAISARGRAGPRYDPKIIVEQGFVGARELECGVLADLGGGPRWPAKSPRSGYTPRPASTTSMPSTSPRSRSRWTCRPTSRPTWPARQQLAVRPSRRSAARVWPGWTSSSPTPAGRGQRDQHHARLHRALDVPPDVGRERRTYPALVDRLITLALRRPLGLR